MSIDTRPAGACPICDGDHFGEHAGRLGARCEGCGALERHRALARAHAWRLAHGDRRTALEIGPLNRRVFGDHLRERGWTYVGIDGSRRGNPRDPRSVEFIDYEADARELAPIPDATIALVVVQHVLEEIDEYERVLAQIARVLTSEGTALLEIPFDPERQRSKRHPPDRFGNVWSFGTDLVDVVREHFAAVDVIAYTEGVSRGHLLACGNPLLNPVARENALPGDADWWGPPAPSDAIEGYASRCSTRTGELLELHVSTDPAQRYRVTVHRLGWYDGAGGRTVAVHPGPRSDLQGLAREPPPILPGPRVQSCGWPVTDVIAVEDDWTTGVYVARLTLTTGEHAGRGAFVPFVVRPALGTAAAVLVQQPALTAQAHNDFGGRSLASRGSAGEPGAVQVTLERPLAAWGSTDPEADWPFAWDYQLLRFLEREGLDLSYTTDIDTDREPWSVDGHRLLIASGHHEYWTDATRDAFGRARDRSTNLACMSAGTGHRPIRLEDGRRTIVGGGAASTAIAEPSDELTPGHRWYEGTGLTPPADVSAYTADSGALVFAAGVPQFTWGLDDWGHVGLADERLQRFMRNALADLVG